MNNLSYNELFNDALEDFIKYTPTYAIMCKGNFGAALLLRQIQFREKHNGVFFKFRGPCNNPHYKIGDSWIEELQCTKTQFDSALKIIGQKINKKTKRDPDVFVYYWMDSIGRTFYELNKEYIAEQYRKAISHRIKIEEIMEEEREKGELSLPIYEKIIKETYKNSSQIKNPDSSNHVEKNQKNNDSVSTLNKKRTRKKSSVSTRNTKRIRNPDLGNQESGFGESENMISYNTENTTKNTTKSINPFSSEKGSQSSPSKNDKDLDAKVEPFEDDVLRTEQDKILDYWKSCNGIVHKSDKTKGMIKIRSTIEELLIDGRNPYAPVEDEFITKKWTSDEIISCINYYVHVLKKDISKWYFNDFVMFYKNQIKFSNIPNKSLLVMCFREHTDLHKTKESDELKRLIISSFNEKRLSSVSSNDEFIYDDIVISEKVFIKASEYLEEIKKKYTPVNATSIGNLFIDYVKEKLKNMDFKFSYIAGKQFGEEFKTAMIKRNSIGNKKQTGIFGTVEERERQRAELNKIKHTLSEAEYKKRMNKIGRLFVKDGKITYKTIGRR